MTRQPRGTTALIVALAATAACSSGPKTLQTTPGPIHGDPAAIANARPDSNRFPHTEADVHFMSGMIGHHSQAIAMSKLAPTRAAGTCGGSIRSRSTRRARTAPTSGA